MSLRKSLKEKEQKLVIELKKRYSNMDIRKKRMMNLLPYIIIYMSILVYFSGFIQTVDDVIIFTVAAVILGIFSFFLPLSKLINNRKM